MLDRVTNCSSMIALAMDGSGIPKSAEDRLEVTRRVMAATRTAGVLDEKVYVDPLIMTVATDTWTALAAPESIRAIRQEHLDARIARGLSSTSFGLPGQSRINNNFLSLAMAARLDSAIADPTHQEPREALLITEMLLGGIITTGREYE